MADCFRYAALTLCEANAALCAADPGDAPGAGRSRQHTVLELPGALHRGGLPPRGAGAGRRPGHPRLVGSSTGCACPPICARSRPTRSHQGQQVQGHARGAAVVGQPASTIDPRAWLREGKIVIVNTGAGAVGGDAAALLGGTLINLVKEALAAQQARGAARATG